MPSPHNRQLPVRSLHGLAIVSIVLACAGFAWIILFVAGLPLVWALGIGAIMSGAGAVLGHTARRRRVASSLNGYDLALAGSIIGCLATSLDLLLLAIVWLGASLDAGTS
jgi:hypothetical protein